MEENFPSPEVVSVILESILGRVNALFKNTSIGDLIKCCQVYSIAYLANNGYGEIAGRSALL